MPVETSYRPVPSRSSSTAILVSLVARSTRAFLHQLSRQVRDQLVLIWDRLQAHRSPKIQAFLLRHHRFHLEWLPPYAPELNPVEYAWSWLKNNPLANHATRDVLELTQSARAQTRRLHRRPNLLWSFMNHSPLSLRHR